MDAKDIVLHLKQAELQYKLVVEAGHELDRAFKQLQEWSEDWHCQRRVCEDIYDAEHLVLIHCNQLSRIFWPAKCCGELGLDLCHRSMALHSEINLPDLRHPLRNEILGRLGSDLDRSVNENSVTRRYNTPLNQL